MDEPVGDACGYQHYTGGEDIHWFELIVIKNDHLPGDRHQSSGQHDFHMNDIIAKIEDDVLEDLDGYEDHHKGAEGHQDISHGEDEARFGSKSLIDGPGYIYHS